MKTGRPKNDRNSVRSETLEFRLSPSEKTAFQEAADIAGIPLSAWIRERLRRAARKELEESGQKIAFMEHITLE
jgi:uncharacterized protein (DUF1778 family)